MVIVIVYSLIYLGYFLLSTLLLISLLIQKFSIRDLLLEIYYYEHAIKNIHL